jgi:hypothetical protein
MSTNREFEPIARAFMAAGPTQLADRVLERSLADVHHTRQRRALLRAPWRTPVMNIYAKLAAAAVAVVAVGALGIWFLNPGSSSAPGGPPPTPSAAPTAAPSPSPTPEPSAVPTSGGGSAPPLTGTFTSTRNGISLAAPAGWTTQPATEPGPEVWADGWITFGDPFADWIYDPVLRGSLWLGIASLPLGSAAPAQWPADQFEATECAVPLPVSVDGAAGVIGADFVSTECSVVFVAAGDRGYQIRLYASDDSAVYDRAWFDELLATVQLTPEDAVD